MTDIAILLSISLLGMISWAANVLGLPGNWVIVATAAGCWYWVDEEKSLHVGLIAVVILLAIAALGELLEFIAGALGASRVGGTWRGTALAVAGSIGGAIVGLVVGNLIPIPILGPVIASLLLGGVGAFGGAVVGERWAGKQWEESIQVGNAAFWGRLLGTLGKVVCGTVLYFVFLLVIWTPL
jgi:uncharacterized protein